MELRFEESSRDCWSEVFRKEEKCRVELEGVVPDVNEDVGRVASVQCSVLLKSKDTAPGGVTLGGEAEAVVLYITENADAVSTVRLTKEFSCELETGEARISEAQGNLRVLRTEARILNPRKLSVCVEIGCEILGFGKTSQTLSLLPAQENAGMLEGLRQQHSVQLINTVTEKSFALSESFVFPSGRPEPREILCRSLDFRLLEQNRIGSRLIVKGEMALSVLYTADGARWPLRQVFTAPLSQILDLGGEESECVTLRCLPTSVYLNLSDSISGAKALEAEVHGLLQAVGRITETADTLADAYSNRMPLSCGSRALMLPGCGPMEKSVSRTEELIAVAEDCVDVVSVLPVLNRDDTAVTADLDILYRTKNGELSAVRRSLELKGESLPPDARVLSAYLSDCDLRPDGEGIQCTMEAVLIWQRETKTQVQAVTAVTLDEEHPYDRSALPAVTLVRSEGESLWELARICHSSVEAIQAMNGTEPAVGSMLLIPRL